MTDRIFTREEAVERLRQLGEIYAVKTATLAKLACIGGGPVMIRCGRRVGYRESDLLQWAESRTRVVGSTSDPGSDL